MSNSKDLSEVRECLSCNGLVVPVQKDGRFYHYKGVFILVPKDVTIPKCSRCGEEWLDDRQADTMLAVLDREYQAHAGLIDIIKKMGARAQNPFPC